MSLCPDLVEPLTETKALQTAWQGHTFQTLVNAVTKLQALQTTWQGHYVQAVSIQRMESQAL
jgi:uncharacterized protein YukE